MKSLLIGIVFLSIGAFFVIWGKGQVDQSAASKAWPVVQGKITQSQVTSYRSTSHSKGRTRSTTMYSPKVVYTYSVGGQSYSCDRIFSSDYSSSSAKRARKLVAKYRTGTTVDVHYDPDNPQEAVLEPGGNLMTYLPLGMGLLVSLVGLGLSLKSLWRMFVKMLRLVFYVAASRR